MTFTQFLQVLAFNLLSNTIPLCLLLLLTAYLIMKMYEKKANNMILGAISTLAKQELHKTTSNMERRKQLADED